jgi:nucleotide-binding universal stress UspA family protein
MTTFQRILFPVDFSERSRAIVPYVRAMVRRFGSEVTVLHVVDLPSPGIGIAPPEAEAWATLIGADRMREQGKTSLAHFVSTELSGLPLTTESAEGDPATMIVESAARADLIMMSTAGRGRFRRFLLGSVTAKVLHDADTPVWTGVHAEEIAAHPPDRWKRMLCAVDDQEDSLPVLKWAGAFACEQKLELRLVHAIGGADDSEANPKLQEFLRDVATERLEKMQVRAGTKLEICYEFGNPAQVVRQAA